MKSAGLPKIEMAGRNLSVAYAPPGAKRIDDEYSLFIYVECVTAATLCDPRTIFLF